MKKTAAIVALCIGLSLVPLTGAIAQQGSEAETTERGSWMGFVRSAAGSNKLDLKYKPGKSLDIEFHGTWSPNSTLLINGKRIILDNDKEIKKYKILTDYKIVVEKGKIQGHYRYNDV